MSDATKHPEADRGLDLDLSDDEEATSGPATGTPEAEKPATKSKWLDAVYTWKGQHFGPSRFPGHHIDVPHDFPDHVGGVEPTPDTWTAPPVSDVKVPDTDPNAVL